MDSKEPPPIITALTKAIEATFDTVVAVFVDLLAGMIRLFLWVGIIGFGLVFVTETIQYEMVLPYANLDLSMRAFMMATLFYGLLLFVRALRNAAVSAGRAR